MPTDNSITAVDIALEPDATMERHAEAVNAELLAAFPKGFPLGATHQPHISILQRYVRNHRDGVCIFEPHVHASPVAGRPEPVRPPSPPVVEKERAAAVSGRERYRTVPTFFP